MSQYKSYCITVRPGNGLSVETEKRILKYLKKNVDYAFASIEKKDEARHMHIQIWYEEPRARGTVCTTFVRICEETIDDWSEAQKRVLRNGIKIAYSDWYLDYLADNDQKKGTEEEGKIVLDNPPDSTTNFYPSEEEQQQIKELANAVDKKYFKYEQDFLAWFKANKDDRAVSLMDICEWYAIAMFRERTICVVADKRRRIETCKALFLYVQKWSHYSENMSENDLSFESFKEDLKNMSSNDLNK